MRCHCHLTQEGSLQQISSLLVGFFVFDFELNLWSLEIASVYACFFFSVDQTPTPTKFLKNCEEIGLFSELNKNPFEEAFKKAADTASDVKAEVGLITAYEILSWTA